MACRYAKNTPVNIVADPARIKQVLVNLIGNAVKFTDRGHVFVNVEAQPLGDEKSNFCISIEDTGIGIAEEQIESCLKRLRRLILSTSRRFGGTGLGLAICRQIASLMNGTIQVKSKLGMGSTFSFNMTVPSNTN